MILSGRISKENVNNLGYQSTFSFRLVAGIKESKNKKEVVMCITKQDNNTQETYNFLIPDNMIDDLYFDKEQMEEKQNDN